jgi:DNA (cytosine-5)-methyltransferase 1
VNRPKLLDLFCCAGGAGMGYHRAGFDVTGVDINPQPNYPFTFHQGDALTYLADHWREFDAIHASPPCQSYLNLGAVNRTLGRDYDHPDLVAATRGALAATGLPYVIENVEGAPLRSPARVCGTGLNLPLRRHRLFESNVMLFGIACAHQRYTEPRYWTGWRPDGQHRLSTVVQVYGNAGGREHWPAAMGIDWMTPDEMCEAVPPAFTEFVGQQLLGVVGSGASKPRGSSRGRRLDTGACLDRRTGSPLHMDAPADSASCEYWPPSTCAETAECCPAWNRGRDAPA